MEDKEEYQLTLEHVKEYLAIKKDDEVIGACNNAMHCLLSETLNYHYPQHRPWRVDTFSFMAPLVPKTNLDTSIFSLRRAFDDTRSHWDNKEVTKDQLRERLESLATQREDIAYYKMHFAPSELFEEVLP